MAVTFPFEVHTPYRCFYSGPVEAVVLSLPDGEIAVYAKHSAFTSPVNACVLRIKENGAWKTAFTAEGILEVKEHKTVLMSGAAEWPSEIDRERAQASKDRALALLASEPLAFEAGRARKSLKRAETRLKVCSTAHSPE